MPTTNGSGAGTNDPTFNAYGKKSSQTALPIWLSLQDGANTFLILIPSGDMGNPKAMVAKSFAPSILFNTSSIGVQAAGPVTSCQHCFAEIEERVLKCRFDEL